MGVNDGVAQRPLCNAPSRTRVLTFGHVNGAPRPGSLTQHQDRVAHGSSARFAVRCLRWPKQALRVRGAPVHGEEASFVSYVDRTLTCADCGVEFIHSAADQEFYAQKGFASDPKRCPSCRAARRATRETSGLDVREIGGPRGYERGYDRDRKSVV